MLDRSITRLAGLAACIGLGLTALSLLDPGLLALSLPGVVLAWGGYAFRREKAAALLLAACLATTYAAVAWSDPDFAADSPSYYVYLRSTLFDRDLDFANEWAHWGFPERPATPTGHRLNQHAAGSACLWSPFVLVGHLYVVVGRGLGLHRWPADGFSLPYLRAAALGTATLVVVGLLLLIRTLMPRFGPALAVVAAVGTTLASPVPYYVLVQPLMAHGNIFALACAFVFVWFRAHQQPTLKRWALLGALLGLLALTRWQAIVYGALLVPLILSGWRRRALPWLWLAAAAAAAVLAFLPQMIAWQLIFGRPLVILEWSRGVGFSWLRPFVLDVLLSADRGLLSWTPVALLGLLGLVALVRTRTSFAIGALAVFVASVWVNGSAGDWSAADAFGARRFDLVFPLLAFGVAELGRLAVGAAQRRPWLLPAGALSLLVLWNFGLMRLYRARVFSEAAPLERVAAAQAGQLRRGAEELGFRLGGWPGRNLAYKFFVGEYFYWNLNLSGTIDVADPTSRYLAGGWSTAREREGGPAFRMAYFPRACVRIPLMEGFDLRVTVTAKAPGGLENQTLGLWSNGEKVPAKLLPREWSDLAFLVPGSMLHPGENLLCLEFSDHLRGEKGSQVAAAVAKIQLP